MRPPAATAAVATHDESMPPDRKMPTGTSETSWAATARSSSVHSSAASSASGLLGRGRGRADLPVRMRQAEVAVLPDDGVAGRQLAHLRTIVAGGWT